jgi:hypothetical protein
MSEDELVGLIFISFVDIIVTKEGAEVAEGIITVQG